MNAASRAELLARLNSAPPPGYVAGLGRGATGFTTRSDIGPARDASDSLSTMAGRGAGRGTALGKRSREDGEAVETAQDEDEGGVYADSNYDEFAGYGGSLFAGLAYDQEDEEADAIWESVDKRMAQRGEKRRKEKERELQEKFEAANPKISTLFADLRPQLRKVAPEEWDKIPEIGDRSLRYKAKRPERYMPVPDSLIERARQENEHTNVVVDGGGDTPLGATSVRDLSSIGTARKSLLDLRLSHASDSVSGQTVVDPKGYLTDLKTVRVSSAAEIGDLKKARLLLKSVISTNPGYAPGWIAAARLEEASGRVSVARKLIGRACELCGDHSEDVWLEAARISPPDTARGILARAVQTLPHSVEIWLAAAALEGDLRARRAVLRKALEHVPNSVLLWKAAVELELPEDARLLLARAVECVPDQLELWLALARLEPPDAARRVLNRARRALPNEPAVWIAAARLEEALGGDEGAAAVIRRAVRALSTCVDRDRWLAEAMAAERVGAVATCQAIVAETASLGLDDAVRKRTWLDDAEKAAAAGCVATARALYAHALTVFPGKKSLWLAAAFLEKDYGTVASLEALLKRAVKYVPQCETLWLMAAKEKWTRQADVAGARSVLEEAFMANPNSEKIWLAAVKLERETGETERARALLEKARKRVGDRSVKVWRKSVKLEWGLGAFSEMRQLLDEGLRRFPKDEKLWVMYGRLEAEGLHNYQAAAEVLLRGLKNCPMSVALWLAAANVEGKLGGISKERALLEKARMRVPKQPELWYAAIRAECRHGNRKAALALLAKGLQENPQSGLLWATAVAMEPRATQKAKSVQALKHCENDVHVVVAVAMLFWGSRQIDKARTWFQRAVTLDPSNGDAWVQYYRFEMEYGTPESQAGVIAKCNEAAPKRGIVWSQVRTRRENLQASTEEILKKVAAALAEQQKQEEAPAAAENAS